jgi:uncharacterized membrane protein
MRVNERRIRQLFQASIALKGAHAVIECAGGLALAFVTTTRITDVVTHLTRREISEDPTDFVATHLLRIAGHISAGTKNFYALYLLSHGLVGLALVAGLLREKLWAYPASLAVLSLFIVYQVYRYAHAPSAFLLLLTGFDLLVMFLIWHEYRLLRGRRSKPG